jgi:hypothetical protein
MSAVPLRSTPFHAVLRVFSDILEVVDNGGIASLVSICRLRLTVDYDILLQRLQLSCDFNGYFYDVLSCIRTAGRSG